MFFLVITVCRVLQAFTDGDGKGGQIPLTTWYAHFGNTHCIKPVCVTAFICVCDYRDVNFLHESVLCA